MSAYTVETVLSVRHWTDTLFSFTATRDPAVLELSEPGTPCIGLLFLTDIPKKPRVNDYDYVVIMGYPAGQYVYTPAPHVERTIRKFAAWKCIGRRSPTRP